jgi:hypothetical protein
MRINSGPAFGLKASEIAASPPPSERAGLLVAMRDAIPASLIKAGRIESARYWAASRVRRITAASAMFTNEYAHSGPAREISVVRVAACFVGWLRWRRALIGKMVRVVRIAFSARAWW